MITPQELRIGNLVTINNYRAWPDLKDIPLTVIELSTKMDEYEEELFPKSKGTITLKGDNETYNQFSQFVEPIELTEEWMLKFGFENKLGDYAFSLSGVSFFTLIQDSDGFMLSKFETYIITVKYVHQLQNLFHSLCVEELTIKERIK